MNGTAETRLNETEIAALAEAIHYARDQRGGPWESCGDCWRVARQLERTVADIRDGHV